MLLSARIDGGIEFHKMGPLWLILNRFMLVFTESGRNVQLTITA